jgi:hypothetical protein
VAPNPALLTRVDASTISGAVGASADVLAGDSAMLAGAAGQKHQRVSTQAHTRKHTSHAPGGRMSTSMMPASTSISSILASSGLCVSLRNALQAELSLFCAESTHLPISLHTFPPSLPFL